MESKNYNKLTNITKEKQTHRSREQTSVYRWGEGKEEVWKSKRHKLLVIKYATRIYTKWGIQSIFYNNSKWNITFKNCE